MNKQALHSSETIQRILTAARDVFSANGFSGSTVDGIAQAAGVNKATLYYQIGDKETLYAEVIRSIIEGVADRIAMDLRQAETPVDKLKVYFRNMALAGDRNPWMPRIMLWELASGGGNMPEVALQAFARILALLSEILGEGARKGVFIRTSPVIFHLMVMGSFALYKTSSPIRARVAPPAEKTALEGEKVSGKVASEVERIMFDGVMKPPSARPAAKGFTDNQ
ncbi:MAG: TetR/AcrR family transcriptional regulator [Deltaproteobacteria bacterium]|nr:TetR/AcrR family transcriptional regulator [Deltaproteobacteria bacterium]